MTNWRLRESVAVHVVDHVERLTTGNADAGLRRADRVERAVSGADRPDVSLVLGRIRVVVHVAHAVGQEAPEAIIAEDAGVGALSSRSRGSVGPVGVSQGDNREDAVVGGGPLEAEDVRADAGVVIVRQSRRLGAV